MGLHKAGRVSGSGPVIVYIRIVLNKIVFFISNKKFLLKKKKLIPR